MQTTEVTQGQWKKVMGTNPSYFQNCGEDCPVEQVSWDDVQSFINTLNSMDSVKKYRLPTEAEWEYAARAGSTTAYCFGDDPVRLGEYAWNEGNSGQSTHPVGQKKTNAWGLYDMHGNVWEWCQDWLGDYPSGSMTDARRSSSGADRVLRGGSLNNNARYCRSDYRFIISSDKRSSYYGFRLAVSSGS